MRKPKSQRKEETNGQTHQAYKNREQGKFKVVEKLEETEAVVGPTEQKRVEGPTRQEAFEGRASLLIMLPCDELIRYIIHFEEQFYDIINKVLSNIV